MARHCSKYVNICNISCNFMILCCYYNKKYVICVSYITNISKFTCYAGNFTLGIRENDFVKHLRFELFNYACQLLRILIAVLIK